MKNDAQEIRLTLASASPRRSDLLMQLGLKPAFVIPADINEDPVPGELPRAHALRLSKEKALKIALSNDQETVILAADTVVGVGRRILPKTETEDEARTCLELMSGRSHRVYTGVSLIGFGGLLNSRVVETRLKMKRLSKDEIENYIKCEEWRGKAGGYGIQGRAAAFITHISGSYSNVVGLPLFETNALLVSAGVLP